MRMLLFFEKLVFTVVRVKFSPFPFQYFLLPFEEEVGEECRYRLNFIYAQMSSHIFTGSIVTT